MTTYDVQITCTRVIRVDASSVDNAEQLAYERFDSAPYGNMNTDFIEEVQDESQDK